MYNLIGDTFSAGVLLNLPLLTPFIKPFEVAGGFINGQQASSDDLYISSNPFELPGCKKNPNVLVDVHPFTITF